MDKKQAVISIITLISLISLIYIFFGIFFKVPNISNYDFNSTGLTGNIISNLEKGFQKGDELVGNILFTEQEFEYFGIVQLSKENKPLITKTFNLKEVPKTRLDSGVFFIKIEDLISYTFEESGSYQLFVSILDLNINFEQDFIVD